VTEGVTSGVESPQSPADARAHAGHDQLLVARYAANDAYESELDEARRLVEGCSVCAAVATDIQLISRATAGLPAPRRRRDFRLSLEQAEELRGSFFERLLRRLAAPGMTAALRPVAGVALSLGIVLAIAGTSAGLPQAALPASAPDQEMYALEDAAGTPAAGAPAGQDPGQPAHSPVPHAAPGEAPALQPGGAPGPTGRGVTTNEENEYRIDDIDDGGIEPPETADTLTAADTGGNPLIYAGSLLALASLGVLLLSWFARRRVRDPLLR